MGGDALLVGRVEGEGHHVHKGMVERVEGQVPVSRGQASHHFLGVEAPVAAHGALERAHVVVDDGQGLAQVLLARVGRHELRPPRDAAPHGALAVAHLNVVALAVGRLHMDELAVGHLLELEPVARTRLLELGEGAFKLLEDHTAPLSRNTVIKSREISDILPYRARNAPKSFPKAQFRPETGHQAVKSRISSGKPQRSVKYREKFLNSLPYSAHPDAKNLCSMGAPSQRRGSIALAAPVSPAAEREIPHKAPVETVRVLPCVYHLANHDNVIDLQARRAAPPRLNARVEGTTL